MRRRETERAADVDREAVATRLYQAVTEGRLDLDEFDQRIARAYAARTYGELDRLVDDLPRALARSAAPPLPHPVRSWLAEQWRPWATVVSICVFVWFIIALLGGVVTFWPGWVAVPWGLVLACRSAYGIATGEPQQWAAGRPATR